MRRRAVDLKTVGSLLETGGPGAVRCDACCRRVESCCRKPVNVETRETFFLLNRLSEYSSFSASVPWSVYPNTPLSASLCLSVASASLLAARCVYSSAGEPRVPALREGADGKGGQTPGTRVHPRGGGEAEEQREGERGEGWMEGERERDRVGG